VIAMTSGSKNLKKGKIRIQPGGPVTISETPDLPESDQLPPPAFEAVGKTLKAYLLATRELLAGKYKHLKELAPPHMTASCRPFAFVFNEGILVRYDRVANPELKVLVGTPSELWLDDGSPLDTSLITAAPLLSENFLHCVPDPANYDPGDRVLKITLSAISTTTGESREIAQQKIIAIAPIAADMPGLNGASYPIPVVSVRNDFELMVELESDSQELRRRFLVRNQFRLPVGWEAVSLFRPYRPEIWNPSTAPGWAECDLLATVLQRNLRENQLRSIDPNAEARKRMAQLIAKYQSLLEGNEEPLHQFIKTNPNLLCPTHYRVWSKLSLGKRDTDFVFREPSGDYLLVELEKPSHPLFRSDGQQREELTHAIDQITDWRRYIEDNLRTVQTELGLEGISSNPNCLIIMGRSSALDESNKRKLIALQNTMPKLRILTYDDLIANAKAAAEHILGPIWNTGPGVEVYMLP
jgi:hypothetical protein